MQSDNKKMNLSRDVLAYIPVKLIPAITGLLSIVILTRNLAPEEYGRYSVAITTALLLVQLAGSWLSNSVLYLYPDYLDEKAKSEFRRQTINLQLLVSIPASGIAYAAIYIVTHTQQLALVGGVLVFGQLMQGLLMTFLQSSRKIYTQAISVGLQSTFQIGTLCVLIFAANGKETAAAIAVAVGFLAGNMILFIANRNLQDRIPGVSKVISRELFLKLLGYGLPMCLWFFATQFYMVGDRILLQFFGIDEQLGQYASFRDLATGCAGFLTMPLLMASHPIIMAKWKSRCEPQEIEKIISNNIVILSLIFTPLIALADIVGSYFIIALFGRRYVLPENIMILVIISIYIGSIAIHLQKGLEVTGKTAVMAKISLMTAIFSVIADFIVIPRFEVIGSAAVVVVSSILYLSIVFISVRNTLLPRIPVKFFLKLIIWLLAVDLTMRFSNIILITHFDEKSIIIFNVSCIMLAAVALFISDERIRHIVLSEKYSKKSRNII